MSAPEPEWFLVVVICIAGETFSSKMINSMVYHCAHRNLMSLDIPIVPLIFLITFPLTLN